MLCNNISIFYLICSQVFTFANISNFYIICSQVFTFATNYQEWWEFCVRTDNLIFGIWWNILFLNFNTANVCKWQWNVSDDITMKCLTPALWHVKNNHVQVRNKNILLRSTVEPSECNQLICLCENFAVMLFLQDWSLQAIMKQ